MAAVTDYINIGLVSLFLLALCVDFTLSVDDFGDVDLNEELVDELMPAADKRFARMSYGGYGRSRSRSRSRGRSRYNDYYRKRYRTYYSYYNRPWKYLPNRACYRQKCNTSKDCCRRHNICDRDAKICYDCWFGYRCTSHNDCCQRFPYCDRKRGGCVN